MKEDYKLNFLEKIDPAHIDEADAYEPTKKKPLWLKYGLTAACLCLVIGGMIAASAFLKNRNQPVENTVKNTEEPPVTTTKDNTQEPVNEPTELYIPAIPLPEKTEGYETADMPAIVVYRGSVYEHVDSYNEEEARQVEPLVGNYIGRGKGNLYDDCPPKNPTPESNDYTLEFASNTTDDFFEVNGYDPDFRICSREEREDIYGQKHLTICFYERLNGITLKTGADLFETRLLLQKRRIESVKSIRYVTEKYHTVEIRQDVDFASLPLKEFLSELDQGYFEDYWEKEEYHHIPNEKNARLCLTLDDGTHITLLLIEGGYVEYAPDYAAPLRWYFIRIPQEVFAPVFSACFGPEIATSDSSGT